MTARARTARTQSDDDRRSLVAASLMPSSRLLVMRTRNMTPFATTIGSLRAGLLAGLADCTWRCVGIGLSPSWYKIATKRLRRQAAISERVEGPPVEGETGPLPADGPPPRKTPAHVPF